MSRSVGKASTSNASSKSVITKQQVLILANIYWYRFVSTGQLQVILSKKQIQQVQQRLNLLLERGWIGRNFSKTDRLTGRYASYYLLPKGLKALKLHKDKLDYNGFELDTKVLHNIYKDKTASTRFVNHCLGIGEISNSLTRLYGDELDFFTKTDIASDDYMPEQRPDAYVQLNYTTKSQKTGKSLDKQAEYFLEYLEEIVPFWVYRKRIKQYIEYAEEKEWEDSTKRTLPKILLVCENPTLQRRTLRFLKRAMQSTYEDIYFYVSNREQLAIADKSSTLIWQFVDPDDTDEVRSARLKD